VLASDGQSRGSVESRSDVFKVRRELNRPGESGDSPDMPGRIIQSLSEPVIAPPCVFVVGEPMLAGVVMVALSRIAAKTHERLSVSARNPVPEVMELGINA
jgi:hypothetical protein